MEEFNIYLGEKRITVTNDDGGVSEGQEAFIVDRNFIVAAIARYLKDVHENDKHFRPMYLHTCQYVDYENKQVLVREKSTKGEMYIPYDLLIGCDGVRSVVREAMIKRHPDFSCHVRDIFQRFKAVHVERPPALSSKGMSVLPSILKHAQGIALPEKGNQVNISVGYPLNLFDDEVDEEIKSSDYKVVSKYFKENFKAFELADYDDFAKQWVGQRWNQTGQLNCNMYHSNAMNIILMGDAAHATSPSIGMGMNTALRDAQALYNLLKENKDDLETTLPAYSKARVKEGNSLSTMAVNLFCLDSKVQMKESIKSVIRGFLHKKMPSIVSNDPQALIGLRGMDLSDVYDLATKLNIIPKLRAINEKIIHEHFEKTHGMVKPVEKGNKGRIMGGAMLVALSSMMAWNFMNDA